MYKGPLELDPDRAQSYSPDHPGPMAQLSAQSYMKLISLQLLLWHSTLWMVQEAIPLVPASSGPPSLSLPRSFLLKSLEQVRKIQAKDEVLLEQLCATYKLCHPEELALLGHSLGIPQAPLSSCSSQVLQLELPEPTPQWAPPLQGPPAGSGRDFPELAPTLDVLRLDVSDFATTIWQQMENLGVAPATQPTRSTMPTFASAFQRRAGGVLTTSHLQSFLGMAYRALGYFTQP